MHHDLTISPSGGGGGRGDTPPSARSGTGKNYTRKKTAGKRLDPLPNGNKGRKTLEKGDLEEVLRKINQTPLPSQVVGKVIPPAPVSLFIYLYFHLSLSLSNSLPPPSLTLKKGNNRCYSHRIGKFKKQCCSLCQEIQ